MDKHPINCVGVVAALLVAFLPLTTSAQGWKPERPVEIVIGTSAGGALDKTGRTMQRVLLERKLLEQAAVVNKPGGGGAVGLAYLSQHPGDGHYVMVTGQTLLTNQILGRSKISFTDFTPLAILNVAYIALAVRADSPVKSAKELIERLRRNPGAIAVAVGTGVGTATQASFAHAMFAAGIEVGKIRQVAFGSGGESMTALLGGHIDASSSPVSSIIEQVRAGKLRLLAVGAPRRLQGELADVPTWTELGINSAVETWHGLAGPKGMSAAQIAYWDQAILRMVKDGEWVKDLERSLSANAYRNSAETTTYWLAEYGEMKELYTALGIAKP